MNEESRSGRHLLIWLGLPLVVLIALAAILVMLNRPPVVHVPMPKMPRPNGWDDFANAGSLTSGITPIGPYSSATKQPKDWTAAELRSWMVSATPALDMMRSGLTKQCVCPPVRSFNSPVYAQNARLRELARTVSSEALYYQVIGKPDRAVDSRLDGVEMAVMMQRGAPLTGGFVGLAVESISTAHMEPLFSKLSPSDLAHVAKRMEKISPKRVPYSDILIEESRANAVVLAQMFRDRNRLENACDWNGMFINRSGTPGSAVDRLEHNVSFAFTSKAGMINEWQAYMEALAKEQRKPYTGSSRVTVPSGPLGDVFGHMFVRCRCEFTQSEAVFAVLRTEVAVLRYRADHGGYPRNLEDLAPAYMKSVPIDPFGVGKPLRYRVTKGGKGFLLYSVGADMHDDGGKRSKGSLAFSRRSGDLVAGNLSGD